MILLDTNVVSEAMKPDPDRRVLAWLDAQAAETLFLSSVTEAEDLVGVAALHAGRRRDVLAQAVNGLLALFDARTLPFDGAAARHYAGLAMAARRAGRGFPTPDGYIASIAAAAGFAVATRDKSAFEAAGLTVINPWEDRA